MAHFGRPKGKPTEKYSLRLLGEYLHTLINHPVAFSSEATGKIPAEIVSRMKEGDITLLENVRFYPGEEANDPAFAEELAKLGDLYVNDAFGAAHRAHASTAGITKFVKQSAMGFLMEKEIQYLSHELATPAKPFVVILGGSKVSDKIGVIKALMEKADSILIGGAMANTFWKAQGVPIGASRVEADKLDLAREIVAKGSAIFAPGRCFGSRQNRPRRDRAEHESGQSHTWNHGGLAGRRCRSCNDQSLRERNRQREDSHLEWTGWSFRNSRVCQWHICYCGSVGSLEGDDHHRRRRFCHRGEAGRVG
jgi:3-phosphoglycerate kinase